MENLRKTCLRWGILKSLYEVLCDTRLDMSSSIHDDLEAIRAIIETRDRKIEDAEDLLDWVEGKLIEKAISLDDIAYWEDLLKKAEKGKMAEEEFLSIPFMESLLKKYEFLTRCIR